MELKQNDKIRCREDLCAPCKGCQKRQILCHSSCEEYIQWRMKMHPGKDEAAVGLMDQKRRAVGRAARMRKNKGKWRFGL